MDFSRVPSSREFSSLESVGVIDHFWTDLNLEHLTCMMCIHCIILGLLELQTTWLRKCSAMPSILSLGLFLNGRWDWVLCNWEHHSSELRHVKAKYLTIDCCIQFVVQCHGIRSSKTGSYKRMWTQVDLSLVKKKKTITVLGHNKHQLTVSAPQQLGSVFHSRLPGKRGCLCIWHNDVGSHGKWYSFCTLAMDVWDHGISKIW